MTDRETMLPADTTTEQMSALLDSMPVAVVIVDSTGHLVSVNGRTAQLFGHDRDGLRGKPIEVLLPERFRASHPAWRERFAATPEPRAMGAGRPLWALRADGSEFPVEVGLNPVRIGQAHYVVAAIVDISEREQTQRLQHAVEQLERSNIELQRFAHVASHDLQTPMRSISSFLQLLKTEYGDRLDEQGRDWVRRVVAAVHQLQQLVRDLLDYSKMESIPRAHEPVSIAGVVDSALLFLDSAIAESGAEIEVGALPEVQGDRSQLLQLFQNVIGNALKYRGERTPHIRIGAERDGDRWLFHVQDNGIGIAPRHLERVFEIVQRLHDQTRYAGTGVGLAVCRRIVEGHGGRIWVDSEPGVGSTFRFDLPARS